MYQFPDSTDNEINILPQPTSVPANKKIHFKTILIANVLLAIFVAGIVWFLFFFDSSSHPVNSKPPVTQKNNQNLLGSFTPTPIESNQPPISNNPEKNADVQITSKIITPEQKPAKNEIKTTIENVANTSKKTEQISAVDAITKELEKNQLKSTPTSLSHERSLKTNETLDKNSYIDLNQVLIEKNADTSLEKILTKTNKSMSDSDHALVKQLEQESTVDPNKANVNKTKNTSNSDIYNSISLQKSNDVDKIMAAMGSIKKPPLTETIENKVKHLLTAEKDKYRKTDQYEKKLEPEAKLNKNEMRILTIKNGESIWDIAVRAYGDGNKYKKILDANPLIKKNPSLLKEGVTLRVPL